LRTNKPTRFWNLTTDTITQLSLAPAGTARWGKNQCENDRDGEVDPRERLRITDTGPGRYDAHLHSRAPRNRPVHTPFTAQRTKRL
jgi:hypothetical protein